MLFPHVYLWPKLLAIHETKNIWMGFVLFSVFLRYSAKLWLSLEKKLSFWYVTTNVFPPIKIQFPSSRNLFSNEINEDTPLFSALAHRYGVVPLSVIIASDRILWVFRILNTSVILYFPHLTDLSFASSGASIFPGRPPYWRSALAGWRPPRPSSRPPYV